MRNLERVGHNFHVVDSHKLHELELPSLRSVGATLFLRNNFNLTTIRFDALKQVRLILSCPSSCSRRTHVLLFR